jgi:hypothetical protein
MQKEGLKQVFYYSLVVIFLIGAVLFGIFYSKNQRAIKEKAAEAAKINASSFLSKLSKQKLLSSQCKIVYKPINKHKFSWIDSKTGVWAMDGYSMDIFASTKNNRCCGNINTFDEKIREYFNQNEFTQNIYNASNQNYTYSFENHGFKCIYGYGNVENKEYFCKFSIICGRKNESMTDSDFANIYYLVNTEKRPDKVIVIDKFMDIPEGNFAKGRIGSVYYMNSAKIFIVKKNESGQWVNLSDSASNDRAVDSCYNLSVNKCPPALVNYKCYDDREDKYIKFDGTYDPYK